MINGDDDDFSDNSVASDSDVEEEIDSKPKIKKIIKPVDEDDDDDANTSSTGDEDGFDDFDEDGNIHEKTFDSDDEDIRNENFYMKSLTEETNMFGTDDEDDNDDDDEDGEQYLQKFSEDLKNNVIERHHPELMMHNYQEVEAMCRIVRDEHGNIIDPLHKTMPFITKFEKAKILGERAKQINAGAQPMVQIEDEILDGYLIALKEYEERKIPMIIRRPLPNGGSEYWRFADLELLV